MSVNSSVKKLEHAECKFYRCDGASGAMFLSGAETILLRRSDLLRLHDYTLNHASLRDFCLMRVPMKAGLRPGEIRCLRWEQVDFETLTLFIVDSKKHRAFPVPMDLATADYLKRLKESVPSRFGWVIERDPQGMYWQDLEKPLGYDALDKIVKKWAKAAGCETWRKMSLYDLRHFFAASWAYPADGKRPGNLHALSKILRHKSLAYTQIYLSRLVFYEDIQGEYNRLQTWPFAQEPKTETPVCGNAFFDRWCRVCDHQSTCRWMDQAMASPWAEGCRFFKTKTVEKECEGT